MIHHVPGDRLGPRPACVRVAQGATSGLGTAAVPRLQVATAKVDEGLLFSLADLTTCMPAGLFPHHGKILLGLLSGLRRPRASTIRSIHFPVGRLTRCCSSNRPNDLTPYRGVFRCPLRRREPLSAGFSSRGAGLGGGSSLSPFATIFRASSGSGRCIFSALAGSAVSHASHSSAVCRITGMALACTGAMMPLAAG